MPKSRHRPEGVQTGTRSGFPLPSAWFYHAQLAISDIGFWGWRETVLRHVIPPAA